MVQLEEWFRSWVPNSVFSAGGGRGSVEAWYTSALDIEEVLSVLLILTLISLLRMSFSQLTLLIVVLWIGF